MLVSTEGHHGYRFGEFVLDLNRGALLKNGEEVPLRPKSFEVLRLLVERPGTLVTREELLTRVWPDVIVTDDSLTQCLIEIRRALGDDDKTLVRTVPRRGFIFELPVERTGRDGGARRATRADHRASNLAWLLGALAVLIGAAFGWWALSRAPGEAVTPAAAGAAFDPLPHSIAVLAFDDLSPGGDQAWFAEGISEEVLNLLAQSPGLNVIARTSSFAFRDSNADIRTIAERLNVAHVLEGSVRRDGDRVRVTAQLVDSETETHVWSHTYDRATDDVFGVQDQIARDVAGVLEVEILGNASAKPDHPPKPEAWTAYLRGHYFYNRRGEGDFERALQQYLEAVRLDPGLARAWAGLAAVYFNQVWDGELEPAVGMSLQAEAIENALRLAPDDPVVLNRAGRYHYMAGNHELARELTARAIRLDPDNPLNLGTAAGRAISDGDLETAIRLQRRAAQLDPLGHVNHSNLAGYLMAAGRFDEAEAAYRNAVDLSPNKNPRDLWFVALAQVLGGEPTRALETVRPLPEGLRRWQLEALAHDRLGNRDAAAAALAKLEADDSVQGAFLVAEVYADRGDTDAAIQWLQRMQGRITPDLSPGEGWGYVDLTDFSPLIRQLHGDPGFQAWQEQAFVTAASSFRAFVDGP